MLIITSVFSFLALLAADFFPSIPLFGALLGLWVVIYITRLVIEVVT